MKLEPRPIQQEETMHRLFCLMAIVLIAIGCRDESRNGIKVTAPGVDVEIQPKNDAGKVKVKVDGEKR